MKANELSVGDWVCAKMTVINGEERLTPPMQVVAIGKTWVQLRIDPEAGDPDEYDIEDIRPIPITADILTATDLEIVKVVKRTLNIPISHVHTLQHAMRLAGIENEIKL